MRFVVFYKDILQVGGAERYLFDFVNTLSSKHDVEILCFSFNEATVSFFNYDITKIKCIGGSNRFSKILKLRSYLIHRSVNLICQSGFNECFLATIGTNVGYSLFLHHPHFNSFYSDDIFSFIYKKHKKYILLDDFANLHISRREKKLNITDFIRINFIAILQFLSIKKANKVFVLTGYAKFEKRLIFNKDSIILPAPVSKYFLDNMGVDFHTNSINNFSEFQNPYLLFSGRLIKEKRIDLLLDLYLKYGTLLPRLIIAGDGPEYNSIKRSIIEHNLNIVMLGRVSDLEMIFLMKNASLFITLEWADFNLTVYEALTLGTRVIFGMFYNVEFHDFKYIQEKKLFYVRANIEEIFCTINNVLKISDSSDFDIKYTWNDAINLFLNKI